MLIKHYFQLNTDYKDTPLFVKNTNLSKLSSYNEQEHGDLEIEKFDVDIDSKTLLPTGIITTNSPIKLIIDKKTNLKDLNDQLGNLLKEEYQIQNINGEYLSGIGYQHYDGTFELENMNFTKKLPFMYTSSFSYKHIPFLLNKIKNILEKDENKILLLSIN